MSSCYKTSNNKYFKCPPRMDDGRHFTDYRPNCHVNNLVRTNNAVINSHNYRMFLTHNGQKLMTLNRGYASEKNSCAPCQEPYHQGTMLPEQSVQVCNNKSCNTDFVNNPLWFHAIVKVPFEAWVSGGAIKKLKDTTIAELIKNGEGVVLHGSIDSDGDIQMMPLVQN